MKASHSIVLERTHPKRYNKPERQWWHRFIVISILLPMDHPPLFICSKKRMGGVLLLLRSRIQMLDWDWFLSVLMFTSGSGQNQSHLDHHFVYGNHFFMSLHGHLTILVHKWMVSSQSSKRYWRTFSPLHIFSQLYFQEMVAPCPIPPWFSFMM